MKKGIIVAHNNGLGDLIVMNGCVRHLASEHDVTYLICFESRLKHYEFMYRDDPNIILCSKPHPKNSRQARLRQNVASEEIKNENQDIDWSAGFRRTYWTTPAEWIKYAKKLNLVHNDILPIWPELFYAIMRVPYETRYQAYHMLRDKKREDELMSMLDLPEKYAFVIDDTRKFKYKLNMKTDLPIINPLDFPFWNHTLIFDWAKVIEGASEIHTVDTSWMHLIRMLQLDVPKFYYDVRGLIMIGEGYLNDDFDKGWTRIFPDSAGTELQEKKNYWLK